MRGGTLFTGFQGKRELELELNPTFVTRDYVEFFSFSVEPIKNGVFMKKSLIDLLLSLVLITWLCGEFSVNVSPSGHVYNPKYYQCEEKPIGEFQNNSFYLAACKVLLIFSQNCWSVK